MPTISTSIFRANRHVIGDCIGKNTRNISLLTRTSGVCQPKRSYSVKFPQDHQELNESKPNISQFKYPLFHTFLIASTTYMVLHAVSLSIDIGDEEKKYSEEEADLEQEIKTIVDQKKEMANKRWYSYLWNLKLWK